MITINVLIDDGNATDKTIVAICLTKKGVHVGVTSSSVTMVAAWIVTGSVMVQMIAVMEVMRRIAINLQRLLVRTIRNSNTGGRFLLTQYLLFLQLQSVVLERTEDVHTLVSSPSFVAQWP